MGEGLSGNDLRGDINCCYCILYLFVVKSLNFGYHEENEQLSTSDILILVEFLLGCK